ncbi:hypothetical protein C8F04DRAFT_1402989 [Mycena alexandri]|uniref:Ubiquitin-like protease family profile domain-containing protein n=1 Tax=Mycena alexandri TaxID=1745969 RepID=A0AAD6WQK7_9AGAR|nr:hypothetical protein C8F04DRAFT_1402989 [Mycena alexandri]
MDRIAEISAVLKSGKHGLRGMQLAADDIECFRPGARLKVPGAVINVVGSLLQTLSEKDGGGDFAVFSTWLSPLISKKVKQGPFYGTISGHIEDTYRGHSKEMLLAKARWLFPLYGDKPSPHWVLGWADLAASQLHIFDGVPELQSYMWAEPALVEVVETVFTMLGKQDMNLEPWDVIKHSPSELQRQMNGYACGFFTIHAMRVIGNSESLLTVTNDETPRVRSEILNLIHQNLPLLRPEVVQTPEKDTVMTEPHEGTSLPDMAPEQVVVANCEPDLSPPMILSDLPFEDVDMQHPPSNLTVVRKQVGTMADSLSATSVSGLAYLSLRVYLPLTSGGDDSDSDDEQEGDVVAPLFSCHYKGLQIRLHTHAKIDHVLFNLGASRNVFEETEPEVIIIIIIIISQSIEL